MEYGYIRVFSTDQNENRQLVVLRGGKSQRRPVREAAASLAG